MDKKYIILKENIYEDLFKSVVISGNYPLQKLNDMKDYIDALIIECQDLENINEKLSSALESAENKIDKAIEYINEYESIKAYYEYTDEDGYDEYNYDDDFKENILDILK